LTNKKSFSFYSNLCKERKGFLSFFIQESNFTISKEMIKDHLNYFYKKLIHKIKEAAKWKEVCCQKDKNLKIMNEIINEKSKNLIKIKIN